MKRQADGVGVSNEGGEQTEANGNKRIKLLNNEAGKEGLQMEGNGENSAMDISVNESSHSFNHKDQSHPISKNGSAYEHTDATTEIKDKHFSSQNINENGDINHMTSNNFNGSHDEVVENVSAVSSGISPEMHSNSDGYSVENSKENHSSENDKSMPPVLNHCDHDIHNSESTDSFQSEGFEAFNCTHESGKEVPEKQEATEKINDEGTESVGDIDVTKSTVDVENLMLSHLKITELKGHTDVVFSVAADEDYVLSASADTTVRVWSMERKSTVSTFSGHSNSVTSLLLLNPNQSKALKKRMSLTKVSRIAITGSLDCNLKLWSVLEGKELSSVYTFNGITCLGYLESECIVVVGTEGGKLELWDLVSLKAIRSEHAHEDAVSDIQVKGNHIYSVSVDGTVKVWNYEDEDIYPLYSRKRKEISSDKIGFKPAQWKTVAVSEDVLYLGDNTTNIKVLDWRAGRLHLFKNQTEDEAVCESVVAEKNLLFSSYYDSSSGTGGINVWKLPEMSYVCTLTNEDMYIKSLAVVQKENKLQIVCGGHKLCIWEFDFSSPPSSETECSVHELETLGYEIDEKPVEIKSPEKRSNVSNLDQSSSSNRWCIVM